MRDSGATTAEQQPRRVVLVTGAARRVGRAIALGFAEPGTALAIHHHASAAAAAATVAEAIGRGAEAEAFRADLRAPDAPAALVDAVAARWGRLDLLVNSAAGMVATPLDELTPARWDEIMALNLRAPVFAAHAAARHMRAGGCIVNIADLAAFEHWPSYLAHGVSKAALVHATRALARALAPTIRVNAVAPGAVLLPADFDDAAAARLTASTPLQRLGDPADVVEAVRYLVRATYVTGETLVVDGGRLVRH